eukprot:GHVT01097510.1.p1 GENE.GHVT01097510.1~~GHVT01097510.1.p1  ORF type:complete len:142 (-),score=28.38 GHVT01097510.1:595-1020(-)
MDDVALLFEESDSQRAKTEPDEHDFLQLELNAEAAGVHHDPTVADSRKRKRGESSTEEESDEIEADQDDPVLDAMLSEAEYGDEDPLVPQTGRPTPQTGSDHELLVACGMEEGEASEVIEKEEATGDDFLMWQLQHKQPAP